jgi:DNA-binding transcriptional MerR regulator
MTENLTLEDLVSQSGLTLRTLRFYIQEGLLQGPDTHGKFASYSRQHLDRIEMIKRLKNLRLPIKEIRHLLNNMTTEEIKKLRKYQEILNQNLGTNINKVNEEKQIAQPGISAMEYIRNLERSHGEIQSVYEKNTTRPSAPQQPTSNLKPKPVYKNQILAMNEEETWKRYVIDEGIELNVRGIKDVDDELKVRKLIEYARALFGKQSS